MKTSIAEGRVYTYFLSVGDIVRLHHAYFDRNCPLDPEKFDEYEIIWEQEPERAIYSPQYRGRLIRCHWDGKEITVNKGKENHFNAETEGLKLVRTNQAEGVDCINQAITEFREKTNEMIERAFSRQASQVMA